MYAGAYRGSTKLKQERIFLDMKFAPVEFTGLSQEQWRQRAKELWSAYFGPPT